MLYSRRRMGGIFGVCILLSHSTEVPYIIYVPNAAYPILSPGLLSSSFPHPFPEMCPGSVDLQQLFGQLIHLSVASGSTGRLPAHREPGAVFL